MTPPWIEAMRLRTLPVSVAGVLAGCAYAFRDGMFQPVPAVLCLLVAVLAQIASNFANEYFDYKGGYDTELRTGPRRGVSCGDITPRAMLRATYVTLGAACVAGCGLIYFGGWWMIPVGISVALGALAYSAGPFPLSRNCLGEVAVIIFFGIIPVNFTYYVQSLEFTIPVFKCSLAMGLLISLVLICNNYRDLDEDRVTGKHTLATVFGRRAMAFLYLILGLASCVLLRGDYFADAVIIVLSVQGFMTLIQKNVSAARCTGLLATTSIAILIVSVSLFF